MTLLGTDRTIDFTSIVGGETEIPYDFPVFAESDLDIYLNEVLLTLDSDYTVTGIADDDGGTILLTNALVANDRLQVFRTTEPLQGIDLRPADPFPAESVETGLDVLTAAIQDALGALSRALLLEQTSDDAGLTLPDPVLGGFLGVTTQEPARLVWVVNQTPITLAGSTQETLTAVAGQTVFTLTNTYQPGVGQIHVYINGVRQQSDAFAESGPNTITFTEPLEAGDTVFAVFAAFQNLAGADASAIAFTQAGPGAVPTTVQVKLFDLPTVLDYGAQGDGIVDDTGAFLTALAAHRTVFVPTGTYLLSGALTLPAEASMVMSPAAILNATGGFAIAGEFLGAETAHFPITALVTFTQPNARIRAEWFGAVPAATLPDRAAAFGRALASLTKGGSFEFATDYQTTDATPVVDEIVLPLAAGDLVDTTAKIVGKEGVSTNRAWYGKRVFAYSDGIPTAFIEAAIDEHSDVESNSSWGGAAWQVSGSELQLSVTGLAATTIDWRTEVTVRKHQV